VVQFILSPLLLWRGFFSALLSNALYAAALGYYHYLNFLGYSAMPFLDHTEVRFRQASRYILNVGPFV
jgi:UNC-50 family